MASKLPEDVWALILQHVPQADRLKHCALVCKKLSRAAAAATDALQVSLRDRSQEQQQQLAEAFDSYLQHHGSHVTSLVLQNGGQPLMRLPCPQLLHLEVRSADPLQLGPRGNLPGVLDSCTGLTCLELSDCTVTPTDGLSRLSVLVALRGLQMQWVQQPGGDFVILPGCVLPCLVHLTYLELSQVGVEDVHHVSCLTNLSVLSIQYVYGPHPVRLAPDIAPGFVLPSSLQQLCLSSGFLLEPALVATATQLTYLRLYCVECEVPDGGVSSGAALLAAVAGLQQLVTLQLSSLRGVVWPAPSAAYTALTASSKLQKLAVRCCGLPEAVWEHVFPPARSCPAVREFSTLEVHGNEWCAEAVSRLVRCCPGLQYLNLIVPGSPSVAALRPLTALKHLQLRSQVEAADDVASLAAVAALTTLRSLNLNMWAAGVGGVAGVAGRSSLLPLTALRQLTSLEVNTIGGNVLVFKTDPQQPPDVWLQLLARCRQDTAS